MLTFNFSGRKYVCSKEKLLLQLDTCKLQEGAASVNS